MSTYNTGNPVPSIDPRDLDDNATVFDLLLQSPAASVPDRLGVGRKTWAQMEDDAAALVSPNVAALAAVTPAVDKGVFFSATVPVTMGTYTLTSFSRTLAAGVDATAWRTAISAAKSGANSDITSLTSLSTPLSVAQGGTGVTTSTGTGDTVRSVSPTLTGTPIAPTAAPGTNTTQLATTAMVQAEIANKRVWTSYTPTITAASGTFTSISATGKYMVAFGICNFQVTITVTTKGTGVKPTFTLPFPALAGSGSLPLLGRESAINGKWGGARITAGLLTAVTADYADADLVTADGCVININGSYPIA